MSYSYSYPRLYTCSMKLLTTINEYTKKRTNHTALRIPLNELEFCSEISSVLSFKEGLLQLPGLFSMEQECNIELNSLPTSEVNIWFAYATMVCVKHPCEQIHHIDGFAMGHIDAYRSIFLQSFSLFNLVYGYYALTH